MSLGACGNWSINFQTILCIANMKNDAKNRID